MSVICIYEFDGDGDELEEDFIALLGKEVNDLKFLEDARRMSNIKEVK